MFRPNLHVLVNSRVTRIIQTGVDQGKPAFRAVEFTQTETGQYFISFNHRFLHGSGQVLEPQSPLQKRSFYLRVRLGRHTS
jgi:hypothetical protein